MVFVFKTVLAALVIAFASWLSGKKPELAGFIVALPLVTLLALPFSYAEYQDAKASVDFAKSIFVGIPLTLLFFVPFLLADRFQLGFVTCYITGILCLTVGYVIHRYILSVWMG